MCEFNRNIDKLELTVQLKKPNLKKRFCIPSSFAPLQMSEVGMFLMIVMFETECNVNKPPKIEFLFSAKSFTLERFVGSVHHVKSCQNPEHFPFLLIQRLR